MSRFARLRSDRGASVVEYALVVMLVAGMVLAVGALGKRALASVGSMNDCYDGVCAVAAPSATPTAAPTTLPTPTVTTAPSTAPVPAASPSSSSGKNGNGKNGKNGDNGNNGNGNNDDGDGD